MTLTIKPTSLHYNIVDDDNNKIATFYNKQHAYTFHHAQQLLEALIEVEQSVLAGDGIQDGTIDIVRSAIANATQGKTQ